MKKMASRWLFLVAALGIGSGAASASSGFLSSFSSAYPASQSANNGSCQLCHGPTSSQLNGYGKDFAVKLRAGMTEAASFKAIESMMSDTDPAGASNITEINASTQPGWTVGANNTLYDRNTLAVALTNQTAPSFITGSLDPPVVSVNRPPVLAPIGAKAGNEAQLLTFAATATDPDGNALTFSAGGLPTGATLSPAGAFAWTPTYSQAGNYNVTVTVTDNGSPAQSAFEIVTISVGNVNRPPVLGAVSASQTATQGQLKTIQFTATDPDGDTLVFAGSNLPAGATVTDNGNGSATFSWTPTLAQTGAYPNVTITVTDNGIPPQTATAKFSITVVNANQPPVLAPIGAKTVNEGQTLAFLATATDPDGNALAFSAGNLPSGATFTPAGAFSWTPSFSQAGNHSVTIMATDNGAPPLNASESFTVTVGDVNRPPVLNPIGSKTVAPAQLLTFTATASDPDGGTLTFSAADLPAGASLSQNGVFTWTPDLSQLGNFTMTITVSDGLLTASETFTITVGAVNHPPVLSPSPIGNRTVAESQTLTIAITVSDADGGTPAFSAANLPSGATLLPNGPGAATFSWIPAIGQAGNYPNVTVTASDGSLTDTEVFAITVTAGKSANRPPVLSNPGNKTVNEEQLLVFTLKATDPDKDTLTFASASLPPGAALTPDGAFSWTPAKGQAGNYPVTVTVTDNGTPALTGAPRTFAIAVKASAPASNSLLIEEAEWGGSRLKVEGKVTPGQQTVTVVDPSSGNTLGTALASKDGAWKLEAKLASAPCSVQAKAGSLLSRIQTVDGAPGECRAANDSTDDDRD